jgi:hypothetical protein
LFCYAWSGGIPRDIIRAARACVNIRNRKGGAMGVTELALQIIRRDVADIVDDAVNGGIEIGSTADIGGLLSLQHQLRDESSSLQAVLEACSLNEAVDGGSMDAVTLKRISEYVKIGSATLEFFSEDIYDLLAVHSERVLCVVEELARAKAALAVSPVEAQWYLSRARAKMGSSTDGKD